MIVIGAGITGLATAWQLLQDGLEVTVVEQAGAPAQGASGQNGAQLSYAYVAPLAGPATLRTLPGLLLGSVLGRGDAALRFSPGLSPELWAWCLRFLLACRSGVALRSTRALLELGALSRRQVDAWRAGLGPHAHDIAYADNGKLVLLRDAASWRSARAQVALQAPWGPAQVLLSRAECRALEPALADRGEPLEGGVHTPSEAVADCARVCTRLADAISASGRGRILWQTAALGWQVERGRVTGLRVRRGGAPGARTDAVAGAVTGPAGPSAGLDDTLQADAYVAANGVAAPALLAPLGTRLPVAPLKGYSIELPVSALRALPAVSITDAARKIVFAPLASPDGPAGQPRLRVAGMVELGAPTVAAGAGPVLPLARARQLLAATDQLFGLTSVPADIHPWAGLRPASPTSRPHIGAIRGHGNVWVNAGQGALGFTLAFGSAALLADLMLGRRPAITDLAAFQDGLA